MRHFQNGLVGLGAFIALANDVEWYIVLGFSIIFWGYKGER